MKRYLFLVFLSVLLVWMVGCNPTIPSIISISPSSGTRGQTLDVNIYGTNFSGATSVYFSGTNIWVNSFDVISSTEIQANIHIYQTAQLGPNDVSVTSPYGTGEGEKLFTVAGMPSIRSLSPATGSQGSFVDVTILGEGFYGVTSVSFGSGITVAPDYQVISEYVPVTIIATISISSTATLGTRNVTVTTTHGVATGSGLFTVTAATPGPVVSSVTPKFGLLGQTEEVSIKGSGFTGTPTVSFGAGITINSVTLISSNEIQATIIISSGAVLGWRDVSVTIGGVTGVGIDLFDVYTLI